MQEPNRSGCVVASLKAFARIVDVAALALIIIVVTLLVPTVVWAQEKDLATAQQLSAQAEQLEMAARYREAIPLAEKALAIYEKVLGPGHPDTVMTRGTLAVLYVSAGAFEQAEALLRQSFAIFQKRLGPGDPRGLLSGRAFLVPDEREPQGYGLYSYLLFETPPKNDVERGRYLSTLEAYLRILPPMEELERHKRRSQLNITLIPTKRSIELPADVGEPKRAAQTAEQVLAAYDYARAQVLLEGFGKDVTRSGPYLISRMPSAPEATRLFLDMSHVKPDLVWDWTKTFCWLAAQERSWSEAALQKLALNTRNAIAIGADLTPDIVSALQQWIRVVKVKQSAREPAIR
jgi:tetratricopeptide (TPR) repeat protein